MAESGTTLCPESATHINIDCLDHEELVQSGQMEKKSTSSILVGDLGGTNLRLALFSNGKIILKRDYLTSTTSLARLMRELMAGAKAHHITRAALSLAGPVSQDRSRADITNIGNSITKKSLEKATGLSVLLMNDMEAFSLGILSTKSIVPVPGICNAPEKRGNKAVIAAGTGLGEAILAWTSRGYIPVASEGGHSLLTTITKEQKEFAEFARSKRYYPDLEYVISGRGLVSLYQFFAKKSGSRHETLDAPGISQRGLAGHPVCRKALEMFIEFYAQETASLAFKAKATGGIYIGGRIAVENSKMFLDRTFTRHYAGLYPKSSFIYTMPVFIVMEKDINLYGAAYAALHNVFA